MTKYRVESGDMTCDIDMNISPVGNMHLFLERALLTSGYGGRLGIIFSVSSQVFNTETFSDDDVLYSSTENALKELGRWSEK